MPFYNYSDKILPNLCKGIARSKGGLILLAYAHEIYRTFAEDLQLLRTKSFLISARALPAARGFNPARLRSVYPDVSGMLASRSIGDCREQVGTNF